MAETVTLRNGTDEAKPLVAVQMMVLERMFDEEPMLLFDLVMLARDRDYWDTIWPEHQQKLIERNQVNADGSMHSSTRNIICNSIEGEGVAMKLVNPCKVNS